MKKRTYLLLTVVIIGGLFGFMRWDEYREKDLVEAIEVEEIVEIRYGHDDNMTFDKILNDEQSIQDLVSFFSDYRVKKEGSRDFTSEHPGEQFIIHLEYEDERITIPILIERNVILIELDQYRIINGPIDSEWMEEFLEKQNS